MAKLWVVVGSTGEYSDRVEWPVMAYCQKADAEAHRKAASEEAFRLGASNDCKKVICDAWDDEALKNRFDPNMQVQYTGTGYYIEEVPFTEGGFDPAGSVPASSVPKAG
jgi:hypothetical protein